LDPKLAEIAAGSNEINVQDSHDTLTNAQGTPEGMQYPNLVSTAGGEDLGGGTTVGLTSTLLNIQYAFEATDPRSVGSVTTTDALGKTLTDNLATFQTDGVQRGDIVINFTDQSVTEVLTVTSETEIITRGLRNGTANTFSSSDEYKVWEVSLAELSGGNFVAVDEFGAPIEPVFPTFGRFLTKTAASSATSQNAASLEYSSYEGGVWVDIFSTNELAGQDPLSSLIGNAQFPVNNIPDAVLICNARGLPNTIYIIGDITLDSGDEVGGFKMIGQNPTRSIITINSASGTVGTEIVEATITGNLDGGTILRQAVVSNLNYVNGFVFECMLGSGTISLGGLATAHFLNCFSGIPGESAPVIDMNGAGAQTTPLAIRGYNGGVKIIDLTGGGDSSIDLNSGQVIVDSSCTNGTLVVRGNGKVVDENGVHMNSGTYNGALTLVNEANFGQHTHEIWKMMGLDIASPMTVTPTSRNAGDISQTISGDGATTSTVTRDP
jgi:hypothetical protein